MEFSLLTLPNPFGWGSFSQVAALGQNFQIVWISRRRPTLKDMKYVAGVIVPLKINIYSGTNIAMGNGPLEDVFPT